MSVLTLGQHTCKCGCGRPRKGRSDFATDACRTRHWKQRTGYQARARENGRNGTENGKTTRAKRSGMQVSYRKAVEAVAEELAHLGVRDPEHRARLVLTPVLPARQRTRLNQKETTT